MIMDVKLEIVKESIITSPKRISTGEIYFQFEEFSFPERQWNDFIDVILNWWIIEIIDFIQNHKTNCSLMFMDGPFHIEITRSKNNKNTLDLVLLQDHTNNWNKEIQVSADDLINALKISTNELLRYCHSNNLTSDAFEQLRINYKKLQNLGRSLPEPNR